jgi:hypothetical protein
MVADMTKDRRELAREIGQLLDRMDRESEI